MAYRGSRLNDTGIAINTEIGSRYDKVRQVADEIDAVTIVADNIEDVQFVKDNVANIEAVGGSIDNVNTVADNLGSLPEMVQITEDLGDAYVMFDSAKSEIEADRDEVRLLTQENRDIREDIHGITAVGVSSDKTSAEYNVDTGTIEIEVERGTKIFNIDDTGMPLGVQNYAMYKFDQEPFIDDLVISSNFLVGRVVDVFVDTVTVSWFGTLKGEPGLNVYNTHVYLREIDELLAVSLINIPEGRELKVDDTLFSPSGVVFTVEQIVEGVASIKSLTNLVGPKGEDGKSVTAVTSTYDPHRRITTVIIYGDFFDAPVSFEIKDGWGGDMYRSVYDPTESGVVLEAEKAQALKDAVEIEISGDIEGKADFDGSTSINIEGTLVDTGVTAGTYTQVTVDSKGRVTAAEKSASDVPVGGLLGEVLAKGSDDDLDMVWTDMDETLGNKVVGELE